MILEKWELVHISESVSNPLSYFYHDDEDINYIIKVVSAATNSKVVYTRIFYLRN